MTIKLYNRLYEYLIISRDIFVQSTKHYHSHHAGKEQNDNQRVENAEPLNIRMWHRFQNVIPPGRPFDCVIPLKQSNPSITTSSFFSLGLSRVIVYPMYSRPYHKFHGIRVCHLDRLSNCQRFAWYCQWFLPFTIDRGAVVNTVRHDFYSCW